MSLYRSSLFVLPGKLAESDGEEKKEEREVSKKENRTYDISEESNRRPSLGTSLIDIQDRHMLIIYLCT